MLSNKAKYALRALFALSEKYNEGPILISDLAEQEAIPKKFLELILLELKNHGILQSKKGKGGGYFLGRTPDLVRLGQVIRILDGPLAPLPCVSQTAYRRCDECDDELTCGIRIVMKEVRDATAKVLDGTTLADVLELVDGVPKELPY
jgi:Rrf2 family protein